MLNKDQLKELFTEKKKVVVDQARLDKAYDLLHQGTDQYVNAIIRQIIKNIKNSGLDKDETLNIIQDYLESISRQDMDPVEVAANENFLGKIADIWKDWRGPKDARRGPP
jgi:hypothetical protein